MKVDKFIDILLTKGPKAMGYFHTALETEYPALFEVLSRLFVNAGVNLPPERQLRGIYIPPDCSVLILFVNGGLRDNPEVHVGVYSPDYGRQVNSVSIIVYQCLASLQLEYLSLIHI